LLLGAATHLIWDAFTHENARGVRMFPLLTDYGPEMSGHPLHLYRWLQYGSSVFGLAVVAAALVVWMRHAPIPLESPTRRIARVERVAWIGAYLLPSLVVITWLLLRAWPAGQSPFSNGAALGTVALNAMRSAAASLLLVSALIRVRLAASA
jgi:hypothetical protein